MIFAAHAGLQSILGILMKERFATGPICKRELMRCFHECTAQLLPSSLKIVGGQAYDDAIAEDAKNTFDPLDLVDEVFSCREEGSDETVKYTVVDYIVSAVTGEGSFVLQDGNGRQKQVSVIQFQEMCKVPED
jgi:hypothetical protein